MRKNSPKCPSCDKNMWVRDDAVVVICNCGAHSAPRTGHIYLWPAEIPKGFLAVDIGEPEETV